MSKIKMSRDLSNPKPISEEDYRSMYQIQSMIDHGTYGVVEKAIDKKNGNIVAIKNLKDEGNKETFQIEESVMAAIDHPNVLNCLGYYYINKSKRILLVTPFCSKGNLQSLLQKLTDKTEKFKVKICLELARGLNALHEKNLMHRDMKPANILFDDQWTAKICDFGFSKVDDDLSKSVKVGTPIYRDPNIDGGKYSKKCDIYSLGLIFDTIFRGYSPFRGMKDHQFQRYVNEFQKNISSEVKKLNNCPETIQKIIVKCLNKDQLSRPSASRLLENLEELWKTYQFISIQDGTVFHLDSSQDHKLDTPHHKKNQFFKRTPNRTPNLQRFATGMSSDKSESYKLQSEVYLKNRRSSSLQMKPIEQGSQISKMIKGYFDYEQQMQKVGNARRIFSQLAERRIKIRGINDVAADGRIPIHQLEMIVFVALFGYLHFLKTTTHFLQKKESASNQMTGVLLEELSDGTIKKCLEFLSQETKSSKKAIKKFLVNLNSNKQLYGGAMPDLVKKMVNEGFDKRLSEIESFDRKKIGLEYEQIIKKHQRLFLKDENNLYKKLELIKDIFE